MSATDDLLRSNEAYAAGFANGELPRPPARKLAVLTCMDARLDPARALGLREGDAHVIRNAGGLASDDAIRSLAISQRLLGTEEVVVIHHTDCGMHTLSDEQLRAELAQETGVEPAWAVESCGELDADLRASLARIRTSPFLLHRDRVRGFVYEVETGRLREVA
jgi:carbonic anhydrase